MTVNWASTVWIDLILSLMICLIHLGDRSPFTSGGERGFSEGPLQDSNRAMIRVSRVFVGWKTLRRSFHPLVHAVKSYIKQNRGIVHPSVKDIVHGHDTLRGSWGRTGDTIEGDCTGVPGP